MWRVDGDVKLNWHLFVSLSDQERFVWLRCDSIVEKKQPIVIKLVQLNSCGILKQPFFFKTQIRDYIDGGRDKWVVRKKHLNGKRKPHSILIIIHYFSRKKNLKLHFKLVMKHQQPGRGGQVCADLGYCGWWWRGSTEEFFASCFLLFPPLPALFPQLPVRWRRLSEFFFSDTRRRSLIYLCGREFKKKGANHIRTIKTKSALNDILI